MCEENSYIKVKIAILFACFAHVEPASPGPDSDSTMDTMEVDSSDLDCSRGLDDPEEPSTPDERLFEMDSPFLDREKDEEPIKAIRYNLFPLNMEKILELSRGESPPRDLRHSLIKLSVSWLSVYFPPTCLFSGHPLLLLPKIPKDKIRLLSSGHFQSYLFN